MPVAPAIRKNSQLVLLPKDSRVACHRIARNKIARISTRRYVARRTVQICIRRYGCVGTVSTGELTRSASHLMGVGGSRQRGWTGGEFTRGWLAGGACLLFVLGGMKAIQSPFVVLFPSLFRQTNYLWETSFLNATVSPDYPASSRDEDLFLFKELDRFGRSVSFASRCSRVSWTIGAKSRGWPNRWLVGSEPGRQRHGPV